MNGEYRRLRVPWGADQPPKITIELMNSLLGCFEKKALGEFSMSWHWPDCVICRCEGDATIGKIDRGGWAHARCAQAASRLQPPPEPEPLHCTEQWGEEFEVWE